MLIASHFYIWRVIFRKMMWITWMALKITIDGTIYAMQADHVIFKIANFRQIQLAVLEAYDGTNVIKNGMPEFAFTKKKFI